MKRLLPAQLASVLFIVAVVPLLICAAYSCLPLGSIGPTVFVTYLVDGLLLGVLIGWMLWPRFVTQKRRERTAIRAQVMAATGVVVASVVSGWLLATLSLNLFIGLTAVFGLMDYTLM